MENSIKLDLISEDLDIKTDIIIYENLNVSKNSDKYQYIFQNKFNKKIKQPDKIKWNVYNSNNFIQNYQTNIWEKLILII